MVRMTRIAVLLLVDLVAVSGCATKDWVRDLIVKKEVEMGERMDGLGNQIRTTDANLGETTQIARGAGERADGATAKADGAMTKADGAMTKADGAMTKADGAMAKAGDTDSRLTRLWSNRYNQKAVDTVEVYFAFDRAGLSDGAQTTLVGVVKELQASPTLMVRLGGFTDPKGKRDYNYSLAQRRVEAVRRFLVEKGVELSRVQAIGMGPIEDSSTPESKKRRVTVTLMTDSD